MIIPNELRPGNLVLHNGAIIVVDGIDRSNECVMVQDRHIAIPLADIDPIPLTPELLEKLGATYPYKDDICQISSELFRWRDGELVLWEVDHDVIAAGRPVKFIHEMQNLIFALTGEELTIKETR